MKPTVYSLSVDAAVIWARQSLAYQTAWERGSYWQMKAVLNRFTHDDWVTHDAMKAMGHV